MQQLEPKRLFGSKPIVGKVSAKLCRVEPDHDNSQTFFRCGLEHLPFSNIFVLFFASISLVGEQWLSTVFWWNFEIFSPASSCVRPKSCVHYAQGASPEVKAPRNAHCAFGAASSVINIIFNGYAHFNSNLARHGSSSFVERKKAIMRYNLLMTLVPRTKTCTVVAMGKRGAY